MKKRKSKYTTLQTRGVLVKEKERFDKYARSIGLSSGQDFIRVLIKNVNKGRYPSWGLGLDPDVLQGIQEYESGIGRKIDPAKGILNQI